MRLVIVQPIQGYGALLILSIAYLLSENHDQERASFVACLP